MHFLPLPFLNLLHRPPRYPPRTLTSPVLTLPDSPVPAVSVATKLDLDIAPNIRKEESKAPARKQKKWSPAKRILATLILLYVAITVRVSYEDPILDISYSHENFEALFRVPIDPRVQDADFAWRVRSYTRHHGDNLTVDDDIRILAAITNVDPATVTSPQAIARMLSVIDERSQAMAPFIKQLPFYVGASQLFRALFTPQDAAHLAKAIDTLATKSDPIPGVSYHPKNFLENRHYRPKLLIDTARSISGSLITPGVGYNLTVSPTISWDKPCVSYELTVRRNGVSETILGYACGKDGKDWKQSRRPF